MDNSQLQENTKSVLLEVIGARNLPLTKTRRKCANAFLKLDTENFRDRTQTVQDSSAPVWNESFTVPNVQDSTILSLRVFHRPPVLRSYCISEVQIRLTTLLQDKSDNQKINLLLTCSRHNSDGGVLVIRLKEASLVQACNAVIDTAEKTRERILATLARPDTGSRLLDIIPSLDPFIEIADKAAAIHPFVNIAWQIASLIIKIPRGQLERDQNVINLITTMEDLFSYVASVNSLPLTPVLAETVHQILKQTIQCMLFIRAYARSSFMERALTQPFSDVHNKMAEFRDVFTRLKERVTTMSSVHIALISSRSLDLIEDLTRKAKLNPVDMPTAGRPSCLPETRLDVIKTITSWIVDEDQKPVFWLFGQTGSGKSTISTTIADISRELRCLGAFVFFNRDVKDRSDPSLMTTTLAYKLASFDAGLGDAVSAAIKTIPDIAESPLHFQFRNLVVQPIQAAGSQGPLVIVIDALDECGSPESRKILMSVLTQEISNFPPFTRILITSRPEDDIKVALHLHPSVIAHELDITSESTEHDIHTFIMSEMTEIRRFSSALNLESDWPGAEKVTALTKRAAGLFIWASTACTFISGCYDPRRNLDLLTSIAVSTIPLEALDYLYETALRSAGDWSDDIFRADCVAILGLVLIAKVPLLCESIHGILCLSRPTLYTIKGLRSVLRWSESEPIRILHPSFQDFLSDQRRWGRSPWFIALEVHHNDIALRCIALLERQLKKNFCNLVVREPFANRIPESLSYACIYWIEHICLAKKTDVNLRRIYTFLSKHLLHWMEVMSIMGMSRIAIRELRRLYEWIKLEGHERLSQLISDARRFSQFFADAIEEHPLLIYATAVPFCPVNTIIYQLFHHDAMLRVTGAVQLGWPMLGLQLRGHVNGVRSIAFSRDGSKIVSGSEDRTIRVWDVSTGAETLPPLRGHDGWLRSVSFSPDGSIIVSGSDDHTIRIWDASTGTETLPPLQGHTGIVYSVMFSQDGSKIVSASADNTIRIWDSITGAEIIPPFQGHNGQVNSAAFAPDNSRIVSGSDDKTVRVWNVTTGTEVIPPLCGHEHYVISVAFSNDGSKIVSGSADETIRVWDARTGAAILPPLTEHKDWVRSVAFSPDDLTIVSGSSDSTIRIWDVTNGRMTLPPFQGHNGYVYSVAYSCNGSKILSGSADNMVLVWDVTIGAETRLLLQGSDDSVECVAFSHDDLRIVAGLESGIIRVWDSSTGTEAPPLLRGHNNTVHCVTFSHDNTLIVSGSSDTTVCIWDAITGTKTLPPLRGHGGSVLSVAFSHDDSLIVSGSSDATVRIWDARTGTETILPFRGHFGFVNSVAFSSDSSRVVSGSGDGTVRVWDTSTGAETLPSLQTNFAVFSVAISRDSSKIASGLFCGTIHVWDVITRTEIFPPLRSHNDRIRSMAFAHGDSKIISSSRDKTIRAWDASTGTEISQCFGGHPITQDSQDTDAIDPLSPGFITIDRNGWVTDTATGRRTKLPTGLQFERFDTSGSTLVAWTEDDEIVFIQFPPAS